MRMLDLPPVWLAVCLAVTWVMPWGLPGGTFFWPGVTLIVVAGGLVVAALAAFAQARTTVMPHRVPQALVTGGIFRFSRNPIYLADLLILLGFALIWGRVVGLLLVPVLAILLQRRFILPEEARMREKFGAEFDAYTAATRRWL
ncbi:MAG: isoprenylcysteine carboxylmethyltransferase family protein [Paracoccaceae bacterium]|nr:isoprenylcysteine carboxylmethyltransferase family protein [Paracoccaceae bacterium]